MTEINAAIPLEAQQPNPFLQAGQAVGLANSFQQNKLLGTQAQAAQQELGARQAIGAALQQATDPSTGQVDYAKANMLIAGNPAAAYGAPAALADSTAQQRQQQGLSQDQVSTFKAHLGALSDAVSPLLAKPPGSLTMDDVRGAASNLISNPDVPPALKDDLTKQTVGFLATLPPNATDPVIRQSLTQLQARMQSQQAQFAALVGGNTATDTGPNIVMGRQSPLGGYQPTAIVAKGLGPDAASTPTPVVSKNPDGSFTEGTIPRGQYAGFAASQPGGIAPSSPGLTAQGMTLAEASQPTTVVDPTTGKPSFAPKGAIAANPGAYSPGLAPGASAALTTAGTQAADMATTLTKQAAGVPQRKAALDTALGEMENFTPGPKADLTKQMGALASEFGVASPGQVTGTAAQEEFGKLAVQIAQSQFQSLGGTGTDAKLESTMHTSPSEFLSSQGNKNIIALLKGNEDAIAAQNQAYQTWAKTHSPDTFPQFQAQWNRIYDPRVFQSQYMTPGQIKTMKSGMTPAELQQYSASQALAERYGWVQ